MIKIMHYIVFPREILFLTSDSQNLDFLNPHLDYPFLDYDPYNVMNVVLIGPIYNIGDPIQTFLLNFFKIFYLFDFFFKFREPFRLKVLVFLLATI